MLTAAVIYIILPELVHVHTREVSRMLFTILLGLAFVIATVALMVRNRMVERAASQLALAPTDAAALNRWRMGHIVLFALSESIVLYGLVLRFIGASILQAGVLYAGGIALLLMFTPRRPA
jgi:hypothetical protein